MISTQTVVVDAQDNPDLDLLMQNAITGYLRARDQLQRDMDALDAYQSATNALYVAFVQGFSITDRQNPMQGISSFPQSTDPAARC